MRFSISIENIPSQRYDRSHRTNLSEKPTTSSFFKDTHREKGPSNKTPGLTKSKNMSILIVGTSDRLFIRGS